MSAQVADALLSPSDVAELAGVGRSVVSNWRKRHDDFPPAVAGSEAKPLFGRRAVVAWLSERGYKVENPASGRIWSALNAIRDRVRSEDAADFVLLLATLKRSVPGSFTRLVQTHPAEQGAELGRAVLELRELPGLVDLESPPKALLELQPSLSLVVDAVANTPDQELAGAVDAVLERLSRWQIKSGADSGFIGSRTSVLLSSLASAGAGAQGVVYDPACGIANALIRVADRGRIGQLVGSDVSRAALRVAAQRALLHGVSIEFSLGDILVTDPQPGLRADVIVAEPPFGMAWDSSIALTDPRFAFGVPPRSASDLAWVQHAIAHLASGGRAYVLTTMGALQRGGPERQIRTNLLSAGCVEAIVALPPKMLPHTSIGLALWVLRSRTQPADVLLTDASHQGAEGIEPLVAAWLTDPSAKARFDLPHASVPVTELLAADAVLTPARWLGEFEAVNEAHIQWSLLTASARLSQTTRSIGASSVDLSALGHMPEPRTAKVRELVESGVVEIRAGRPARDRSPAAEERIVTVEDIKGRYPLTSTAELAPVVDPDLTEPGDVLVTSTSDVRATVDPAGGHLAGTGVERLRVLDSNVLTPEYLAAVLPGSWNERLLAGATVRRAPVRELEIPLIPVEDQRSLVRLLDSVEAVRTLSVRLRLEALWMEKSILDALRHHVQPQPTSSDEPRSRPAARRHGHDSSKQSEGTE